MAEDSNPMFQNVFRLMEEYPYLSLLIPIIIFGTIDVLSGVNLYYLIIFTTLSYILTTIAVITLKQMIRKERVGRREYDGYQRFSFPSNHTALGSTLCIVQSVILPVTTPLMAFLILLTSIGRIRLNKHDLVDVLGGIAVAILVVIVSFKLTSAILDGANII